MKHFNISIFSLFLIFFCFSCELENENTLSQVDEDSHNSGNDCLLCHKSQGNGEGIFSIAGTVYDSLKQSVYTNARVYVYNGPNTSGVLLFSIPVDQSGNFYTSTKVDFTKDIYVGVKSNNGTMLYMNSKLTAGNCNSCHGKATDYIWVK